MAKIEAWFLRPGYRVWYKDEVREVKSFGASSWATNGGEKVVYITFADGSGAQLKPSTELIVSRSPQDDEEFLQALLTQQRSS